MIIKQSIVRSRRLIIIVILVGLLTMVLPNSVAKADTVVTFPDPNLEAAIRDSIGKPTGDIYDTDLVGMTNLNAVGKSITNITGLEYCTDLISLHLQSNNITNISPLSGLINLTTLDLGYNHISDISPLSGLTSLIWLHLDHNYISNIPVLSGLPNLTTLDLNDNQISSISPPTGLISLHHLDLYSNQISDISSLSGLTSLTGLSIYSNQISDISPLSGLTNLINLSIGLNQISDITPLSSLSSLTSLSIGGNNISNISPISGLTSLESLGLSNNQISDISSLSGLINLANLSLAYNQISDISSLSGLTSLTELYLQFNQISAIPPLSGLPSLTELYLFSNQISDISGLSGLTSLTYLSLYDNQISDISSLSGLTNLTSLNLFKNQISDTSSLSGLTNLRGLQLHYNQISDISSISGLANLTSLRLSSNQISAVPSLSSLASLTYLGLSYNQISDISGLSSPTNLTYLELDLNHNQISDIEPLIDNTGISNGDEIDLNNNILSDTSLYVYIPQLQARGADVWYTIPTPPNTPSNPSPPDNATGVDINADLSWSGGDPNGDIVTYDVYFGTDSNPTNLVSDDQSGTTYDPGTLNYNTHYYWKIVATDEHGWSTDGPVWDIFTASQPPDQPTNTLPTNGTTGVSVIPTLQSSAFNDPDAGDTHAASEWQLTDIAGNYTSPVFESGIDATNLTSITVSIALDYSTTYYWHVRHQDNNGVWSDWSAETSFTTANPIGQPPTADAGPNQEIIDTDKDGFQEVELNGSGSDDPDGTIDSYEWKEGATVIGIEEIVRYNFAVGSHIVTLTVTDNDGNIASDTVTITVTTEKGGCFIATAAFGTPMAEEIDILRDFRDQYMLTNPVGEALVKFYYNTSPPIADFIAERPVLKQVVRTGLEPVIAISTVVVNTTMIQKIAIIGSKVLICILIVWLRRRAGRESTS